MTKYARIVLEVPIEDDEEEQEIVDAMEAHLADFTTGIWGIDDIEIHKRPYIADECDSDPVTKKEE